MTGVQTCALPICGFQIARRTTGHAGPDRFSGVENSFLQRRRACASHADADGVGANGRRQLLSQRAKVPDQLRVRDEPEIRRPGFDARDFASAHQQRHGARPTTLDAEQNGNISRLD